MIALITAKNPKSVAKVPQKFEISAPNLDTKKSRLVAQWLSDDQGHRYCQWVTIE